MIKQDSGKFRNFPESCFNFYLLRRRNLKEVASPFLGKK
ncbi:hypothetical protein STRDD10_01417 [Streptococcus sp. DD10]|nr:hypothetical protein STRDD10_01417 [Streptococcus sp. DD10]